MEPECLNRLSLDVPNFRDVKDKLWLLYQQNNSECIVMLFFFQII